MSTAASAPRDDHVERPGIRGRWGVLLPAPNVTAEHDLWTAAPPGITFHVARLMVPSHAFNEDELFVTGREVPQAHLRGALEELMTLHPTHLLFGVSALTMWDGLAGRERVRQQIEEWSGGVRVTLAADAVSSALAVYRPRRVAVLAPYPPVVISRMRAYLEEDGYEVVAQRSFDIPYGHQIGDISPSDLHQALIELSEQKPDLIVQLGAGISMPRVADTAEKLLGLPVLALNIAVLWHALRTTGIRDRIDGFGGLLRDH